MAISFSTLQEKLIREMDGAHDGFWLLDANLRTEYANDRLAEMLGYRVEEMHDRSIYNFIEFEDWEKLKDRIHQWQQGIPGRFECRYRRKDGSQGWAQLSLHPISLDRSEWVGMPIAFREIGNLSPCDGLSALARMEEELQRRERQFKTLADRIPTLIARFDRQLRYIYVNPAMENATGISIEAFMGKTNSELAIAPEAFAKWDAKLRQTFSTGKECSFQIDFPAPDGIRSFQTKFVPELTAGGSFDTVLSISSEIPDYKRVEEEFRKSEARFRSVFESNMMGMGFWDIEGNITEANDALLESLGYTREEFETQGLNWRDITPPEYRDADLQARAEALEKGYSTPYEKKHIRKDGTQIPAIGGGATFEGTKDSGVFFFIDQSDRKRMEVAQKYLADASNILASSLDYETTLSTVAQLTVPHLADWCTVHVVAEDGTVQGVATAHTNPEKVAWAKEINKKYPFDPNAPRGAAHTIRTGESELYSYIPDHLLVEAARDEEHLQLLREVGFSSVIIVPMRARGRILGVISFVAAESGRRYDRTDLGIAEELGRHAGLAIDNSRLYYQAQQARDAAERSADRVSRLQTVTAALSEALTPAQVAEVVIHQGIAALGANAGSLFMLREKETLQVFGAIGYPQEVLEKWQSFPVSAAVPIAEAVRTGELIFKTIQDVSQYPIIADLPKQTGNKTFVAIPLIVHGRTLGVMGLSFAELRKFSPGDRVFIFALGQQCAQAIARAQLYEAEQSARTEAEKANRVRDEFIAVLSHELRSPLNPILGWAKLLQMRKFDDTKTTHALQTIERNAQLQARLIDDLLDISRILRGKLSLDVTRVNLGQTIESALETVRLAAEAKSIHLKTEIPSAEIAVLGDPNRLQQVVWNLVSNAVKFTPPGGTVTIRLECFGDRVQIHVRDTGRGISPEFLPHVFDYFRQADSKTTRAFGGLGLGLAIVRNLTELHGGTVMADSTGEGEGATFTVTLPIVEIQAESVEEIAIAPSIALEGMDILVVDDEADTREFLEFVLCEYGARVRAVGSAMDAIAQIERSVPDILVSDIGMPEVDGYMLIRQIRQWESHQGGKIAAIALTAYAGESNRQQILKAGFQEHLVKPIEPAQLIAAIGGLVKG